MIHNASFAVVGGEVAVVTGRNGTGKSTLLRIVGGLLKPDRGTVVIAGYPMARAGLAARRCIGYVPDGIEAFPDLLVGEYVTLVSALKRASTSQRDDLRDELGVDDVWHQRLATLSLGQRKRTDLLCALLGSPRLLVLDEPSNGLDTSGVALLLGIIADRTAKGVAALVVTNDAAFEQALAGRGLRFSNGELHPSVACAGSLYAPPQND